MTYLIVGLIVGLGVGYWAALVTFNHAVMKIAKAILEANDYAVDKGISEGKYAGMGSHRQHAGQAARNC